jgi:hypothetical protein
MTLSGPARKSLALPNAAGGGGGGGGGTDDIAVTITSRDYGGRKSP